MIKEESKHGTEYDIEEDNSECDLLSKFRELSLENQSFCQPEVTTEVKVYIFI